VKFNFKKTEIIPIGTKRHREQIYQTQKIHPLDPPLDPDIHITNDREAIHSLGAWVGNNATDTALWETIIDKIKMDLTRVQTMYQH